MDSDSLAIQIKSLAFYKDKAKDVKTRYDASNYEKNSLVHTYGKNFKSHWTNEA